MRSLKQWLDSYATPRDVFLIMGTLVLIALLLIFAGVAKAEPQKQPDRKRVKEIQQALIDYGYMTGQVDGNWKKVQTVCHDIADKNGWQVNHAPDARVLILLGLGNKHSNQWVAEQQGNHLDKVQRHED